MSREPYVSAQPAITYFDEKKDIYFNIGEYIDTEKREQLIAPDRNFDYKIRPGNLLGAITSLP